ncbi:MAG TPA: tetraacyldisaccharide 4'-kinase, partial [Plasticicumulans sp.]|nr:tetraacyldisaccharide 4'-kinase [Plasticicumulans sp.]
GLYAVLTALRRLAYRCGWLASERLPVPVVVVGNISVGGTGKTPLLAMLAEALKARGYRPGLIARGYGGRSTHWPRLVDADSDPLEVGDEPVLLAGLTGCPMAVDPDRPAAARRLLAEHPELDLLLADDGLQHYRLARDLEIAVIDGRRCHGNGWLLPAGPLREPVSRLATVDFVVINGEGGSVQPGEYAMRVEGDTCVNLADPTLTRPLAAFRGRRCLHALAGIGDPQKFFASLEAAGLAFERHPFADHHACRPDELDFGPGTTTLMTGKDAVKCRGFPGNQARWWLAVQAVTEPDLAAALAARLPPPRSAAET